jgi:AI-2E family transporter
VQSHINGSFGVAVGLGLFLIGVSYAVLWGFLAAALRFIPYVGLAVSTLLPIALSLSLFPGWVWPLIVIGLVVPRELPIYMVMEPLLYGQSVGVSAVALLVAIACGGGDEARWTILATPLTSAKRDRGQDTLTDEDVQFVVRATRAIVEDLKMRQPHASTLPATPPRALGGAKPVLGSCPLGSDRSPEEAEGAGEDEPNGGVLPDGVLEKTRKDHTREEMWAQAHARSGSQDNGPSVQNVAIAIGKSLLSDSPALFRRTSGNVAAFTPSVIKPVEKSGPPPRAGTAGARDSSPSGSSTALGARP